MNQITEEYDFNKPIRFSHPGLYVFCRRARLIRTDEGVVTHLMRFEDDFENVYVFEIIGAKCAGVAHVKLNPELSRIRVSNNYLLKS